MVDIYLGIGSNIQPVVNISKTIEHLRKEFPSISCSRIFESEAIGFKGDNFHNLVVRFNAADLNLITEKANTIYSTEEKNSTELALLVKKLKAIEILVGRERGGSRFSARIIDIDILLFGDLNTPKPIELPREEILHNAYVLWPLSEIAPDLIHPGCNRTYLDYWKAFDKSSQRLKPIQ